jgi:4-diphosphocytidyl-2-C-methyl-D-erythritol kinase
MKSLLDVPAPAKLNLFLHVTGQRNDGYHLLQSAFMLLDWHDVLHFEVRNDGRITREDLGCGLPDDDLCVRAATSLQRAASCPLGVHIGIRKQIPVQAGMGGGSSDAATCLLALNRLWGLGWSVQQLIQVGVKLGADVPFFLGGAQRLGGGHWRATAPDPTPPRPVCGGQADRGTGDRPHLCRPRTQTRHSNCYNLRLCCGSIWLRPQRPAARGPAVMPGCVPGP